MAGTPGGSDEGLASWNEPAPQKKPAKQEYWTGADKPKDKKPAKRRLWLWISLGVVGLIVLLVLIMPTIAGSLAPGIVEGQAGKQIAGRVKVDSASLGWFSHQRVSTITLSDPTKPVGASADIATLNVEVEKGLLGLATGAMGGGPDLGTVRVSGKVTLIRDADGTTNLDRALAPSASAAKKPEKKPEGSKEPAKIPPSAAARVIIESLDITFVDNFVAKPGTKPLGELKISNFKLDATLEPASAGAASARMKLSATPKAGGASGSLKIDAKADSLTNSDGVLTIDKAKIDADIEASGLPVDLLDALAGMGGKLVAALGPSLDITVAAKGSMKTAEATIGVKSNGASVAGTLGLDNGTAVVGKPVVITVTGPALRALADLDATLAKTGTVALTRAPDVALSLDSLAFKLPTGGAAPDFRGTKLSLSLKTTDTAGTVKLTPDAKASDAFAVAPLDLKIDTADLAKGLTIAGGTTATINNQPAGTLNINVSAAGLLDAKGAPGKGLPSPLDATVALRGIATAIAQPFVQALKLDLPADVGPTLDLELKAQTTAAGGTIDKGAFDLLVKSAKLNAVANLALESGVLRSRDRGISLTADAAGQMASRFVDPSTGWSLAKGGSLTFAVKDLSIPLKNNEPMLADAAARVEVGWNGFKAQPVKAAQAAGGPIDIGGSFLVATLAKGAAPKIELSSPMTYGGKPFSAGATIEIPGLLGFDSAGKPVVTPMAARPTGAITLTNVPSSLAKAAADTAFDIGALADAGVGPAVSVYITTTKGATLAEPLAINTKVRADQLRVDLDAKVSEQAIDLASLTVLSTVTPRAMDVAMQSFAKDLAPRPALAAPAKINVKVDPFTLPLIKTAEGKLAPDAVRAGAINATVTIPEAAILQNLALKDKDGKLTDIGSAGIEALDLKIKAPADAVLAPTQKWLKPFEVTATARLLDGPSSRMGTFALSTTGQLTGSPSAKTDIEAADAKVTLGDLKPAKLDKFTGKPGMLSGALGEAANIELGATIKGAGDARTTDASVKLASPLVSMTEPLRVSVLPDRIKSGGATRIAWQMTPAFAEHVLFAPPEGAKPSQPPPKLTAPSPVSISIDRFAIAKPQEAVNEPGKPAVAGVGPLKPGIFDLALSGTIQAMDLAMADGSKVRLAGTSFGAQSAREGSTDIAFRLDVAEAGITQPNTAPPPAKKMSLSGTLSNLADGNGNIQANAAMVSAVGDLPIIPTALVDALAKQDGLLADALGPTAAVTIKADRFGAAGGTIDVGLTSPRASATIKGDMKQDAKLFTTTDPIRVSLSEVTNALAGRFVKGLPLIGSVEKTPQDEPALITASNMMVPLDNNLARLNGDIVIDPGQARFSAGDQFGSLLKAINQKTMGNVGQRIDPFKATIKDGVMTYQKWSLPLGEFKLMTQGVVDLANRKLDVITYIPIGALTDETAKLFKGKALGAALDDKLVVPWRTRGTFDNRKTEPDFELFLKNLGEGLSPDKILERGLDDLFKPKPKKP